MKKIHHIGIAVPDLEQAVADYKQLGFTFAGEEQVPTQKVDTAFFRVGDAHIELLAPNAEDSPISNFLAKRGSGIHHICVEVDDIEIALAAYKAKGIRLINPEPVVGVGGSKVAFIHPKSCHGVLLELRQSTEASGRRAGESEEAS